MGSTPGFRSLIIILAGYATGAWFWLDRRLVREFERR